MRVYLVLAMAAFLFDKRFNLLNKNGQIRLRKTYMRCGNTVSFDIWRNVFVMRVIF